MSAALEVLRQRVESVWSADSVQAFEGVREKVGGDASALEIYLASLPRKLGRDHPLSGRLELERQVDLATFRSCDLGAALLLLENLDSLPWDLPLSHLFFQGDAEERRMILRSLAIVDPEGKAGGLLLLGEAHRSNDQVLFEVGLLDSDLAASILPMEDFNNAILKASFVDLPAERLYGWEKRANPELSRILLDFMAEREAAQRPVWPDSLQVAAHAPVPGVIPRILASLWSGVDSERLRGAQAFRIARAACDEGELWRSALDQARKERLELETLEPIRRLLES